MCTVPRQEPYSRALLVSTQRFPVCTAVRQCYEFEQSSTLGTAEHPNKTGLFDVVTCMFALHYFFADEQTLKTFLHNVSVNLKPGAHLSLPKALYALLEERASPVAAQHTLHCQVSSRGCKQSLAFFCCCTVCHCWLSTCLPNRSLAEIAIPLCTFCLSGPTAW